MQNRGCLKKFCQEFSFSRVKEYLFERKFVTKRLKSGQKFQTHQFDKESIKNAHKGA